MANVEVQSKAGSESATRTAFLVVDCESIPDGRLLNLVKYARRRDLPTSDAIEKARDGGRGRTRHTGSDFLPSRFRFRWPCACSASPPTSACRPSPASTRRSTARARSSRSSGSACRSTPSAKLVTFNGRGFDLPLLELAAFRYGCPARDYFASGRNRFNGDLDLMDWLTNFGASRGFAGGLNVLAKLLGKPGKMDVSGDQVYEMYKAGQNQEINDYCMFDTLDTYFVFLRTRVLTGEITPEQEVELIAKAKKILAAQSADLPALKHYVDNCTDCNPWP